MTRPEAIVLALLAGLYFFAGKLGLSMAIEFLCFPILVWATFRFGPRETATATCVLAVMAAWPSSRRNSPTSCSWT